MKSIVDIANMTPSEREALAISHVQRMGSPYADFITIRADQIGGSGFHGLPRELIRDYINENFSDWEIISIEFVHSDVVRLPGGGVTRRILEFTVWGRHA